jgi:hypothetical protein
LRLETAGTVARYRDPHLPVIGQERLRTRAVAAVARAAAGRITLLITKMTRQLGSKRPLNQRFLQPLEKTVLGRKVFRLQPLSKRPSRTSGEKSAGM